MNVARLERYGSVGTSQRERERDETKLANSLLSAGKLLPQPLYGDVGLLTATVALHVM